MSAGECRYRAFRADREDRAAGRGTYKGKPADPPEYHGPNPQKTAANQAEFAARQTSGACFHCPLSQVHYSLFHTLCPTHPRNSSVKDRRDPAKRVLGAGRLLI